MSENANNSFCPKCGNELNNAGPFCPSCGLEFKPSKKRSKPGLQILGMVGIIAIVAVLYYGFTNSKVESTAQHQHGQKQDSEHPDMSGMAGSVDMSSMDNMMASLPDDYTSLVDMGNKFMDGHMYLQAVMAYKKALEKDDTDPNLLVDLGTCYHAMGESEKAINYFNDALKLDPKHAIAYLNLGVVYYSMGQTDKTRECWNKLIEISPDEPIADSVRKYLEML